MSIQQVDNRPKTYEWRRKNDFPHTTSRYVRTAEKDGIFMNWESAQWELWEAGELTGFKPFSRVRSDSDLESDTWEA